jgi:hypothetical protein
LVGVHRNFLSVTDRITFHPRSSSQGNSGNKEDEGVPVQEPWITHARRVWMEGRMRYCKLGPQMSPWRLEIRCVSSTVVEIAHSKSGLGYSGVHLVHLQRNKAALDWHQADGGGDGGGDAENGASSFGHSLMRVPHVVGKGEGHMLLLYLLLHRFLEKIFR